MLGDGIVSFGVWPLPAWSRRNANASAKIVSGSVTFSATRIAGRRVVVLALLVAEVHVQALALDLPDPAERVDEVHVPRRAAELAVGDGPQPDVALQLDHVADRVVLARAQRVASIAPALNRARASSSRRGRSRLPT